MIGILTYAVWISSSFRSKNNSIFSPTLTSFQQVITLRNTFFVDWTDQDSGKILVRAVTKVIASNTYLFSFSC